MARRHEQGRQRNLAQLGALDGVDHLIEVDAAEHVMRHVARNGDDRDTDHNPELMQDLLLAQKRNRPAYCFQHLDLELRSDSDGSGANPADATLLPTPLVARFEPEWNSPDDNKTRFFNILGGVDDGGSTVLQQPAAWKRFRGIGDRPGNGQ